MLGFIDISLGSWRRRFKKEWLNVNSRRLKESCTPRNIHALWLLLRARDEFTSDKLERIAEEVFGVVDVEEMRILLRLSTLLGLTSSKEESAWTVTEEGRAFSNLKHWRFWQPPPNIECAGLFLSPEEEPEKRPAVIDLFCGAGGFSLGFESAGFSIRWAIDDDPLACESFKANFPQCRVVQGDICEIAPTLEKGSLPKLGIPLDRLWGIIGGPPCQSFSGIGERNPEDNRSSFVNIFMEVVAKLEPAFFVMENVPGLVSIGRDSSLAQVLKMKAKSVGTLAMKIADALPPVSSTEIKAVPRHDRKRKRIVAEAIRNFHKRLDEEDGGYDKPWSYRAETAFRMLQEVLENHVVGQYHIHLAPVALEALNSCTMELAEIAIAARISKSNQPDDERQDPETILLALLSSNSDPSIIAAVRSILNEYWSGSDSTAHKGVEIGTLLRKGVEIVSDKYEVSAPLVLNAANFGDPQNRLRLFIVGVHRKLGVEFTLKGSGGTLGTPITAGEALSDLPDVDGFAFLQHSDELPSQYLRVPNNDFARSMRLESIGSEDKSIPRADWNPFIVNGCKITAHTPAVRQRYASLPEGGYDRISRRAKLTRGKPAPTVRAGTKADKGAHTAARPIHYEYCRMTTVREGARLMGYPDWMTFHHTNWHGYLLVGNGVPRGLTTAIARRLLELLNTKVDREQAEETATQV